MHKQNNSLQQILKSVKLVQVKLLIFLIITMS